MYILEMENKTKETIRKNVVSLGIDVAERFTGLCLLKTDSDKVEIRDTRVIKTHAKDDHLHRADHYVSALEKYKQILSDYKQYKIMVIESCYYGRNAQTLIHLAHFGILSYVTLKKGVDDYHYMSVLRARSLIGFNQRKQQKITTLKPHIISRGKNKGKTKKIPCKDLVHDYLKTEFDLKFKSKDEADAWVLAMAGLLV